MTAAGVALLAAILIAVVFGMLGVAKVFALGPMPTMAAHLGFSVTAYRRIGVLEVAGAAGVLLGLHFPWLGIAAAAGLLLLLIGALGSHLRAGDAPARSALPLLLSVLVAGYVVAL